MKKRCELCKSREARMYCDSDQASLCWECDERVHTANFLVAKHSRNLLCHVCQSVTQWKASGSKFGPTFSVCQICFNNNNNNNNNNNEGGRSGSGSGSSVRRDDDDQEAETVDSDDDEYSDDSEDDEDDDDDEIEEDGENQVVPWTTPPPPSVSTSPSPPVATTSSSEIGSLYYNTTGAGVDSELKRFRENTFTPDSEDEDGCCSSQVNIAAGVSNNTRIIGRSVGLGQQRSDSERKRVRRMDATSSFLRFQER